MTNLDGVVKLQNFKFEVRNQLQIVALADNCELRNQATVFLLWLIDAREEIKNNILEQRKIVNQKLRYIYISQRSQKQLLFVSVSVVVF